MNNIHKIIFLLFLCISAISNAQEPKKLTSSEIYQSIQKLNFLGSALYIGAHPDDENTRLISYLSNHYHARTAYLSLTRGDGGQNLTGPQIREQLGVIRTQELLAARRVDGGDQLFTRANDFGYSKTPDETLEIWNKEEVLSDVVWAIRTFQPDIVINRFNHRTAGETHGHHTSSALLSVEAFELAQNKNSFPSQLKYTTAFKPQRLFFNTSWYFYGSREEFNKADKSKLLEFNTGVYYPNSGLSNNEIAALSRSKHQSQGFGSTGSRGEETEYLELLEGDMPPDVSNLFDGINTSWSRLKNGAQIGDILNKVEKEYNFKDPSASLKDLVKAYNLITQLEDSYWKTIKTEEIKEIIAASAGLFIEAAATSQFAVAGEEVKVNIEAINRSDKDLFLESVELFPNNSSLSPNKSLENNIAFKESITLKIPGNSDISNAYWLNEEGELGMYNVKDQELIGLPETPAASKARFLIRVLDVTIPFDKNIVYKFNDAVQGEVYRPFEIVPPVSIKMQDDVIIFSNDLEKQIEIELTSYSNDISGTIEFNPSKSWQITPSNSTFDISQKGDSKKIIFKVKPLSAQNEEILTPVVSINQKKYSEEIVKIDYPHIPFQTLVLPSKTKLVKLNIEKKGQNIGYIEGAGDVIPQSLMQIGYTVTSIPVNEISQASLSNYDAVIFGVRAYNTIDELKFKQPQILNYVKSGGTVIVQYNTHRGLVLDNIAPFKLQLSSNRVTDEEADVRFLNANHPVLNTPNKITDKDFEGWVQERGLYFASEWGDEFTPILSMNDKDESPKNGSLLIANYGEGHFIYTGLSFFRQFPAGVAGAFRLFANLVSIGK